MSTEFYNRNWRMPKNSNSSKVSNYSMEFDGTEYVSITDGILLNSSGYTLSAWINVSSFSSVQSLFCTAAGDKFIAVSSATSIRIKDSVNDRSFTVPSMSVNNWHNIILTVDNGSCKVYLNSTESTSGSQIVNQNLNINGITGYSNKHGGSFNLIGKIDHVAVFDYALSASQVTSLYGNSTDGVGNPMELSTKPVAYYKIGDKAAFNGSEYLVTNAASEVYSPYALDFDGTNDYIDLGINNNDLMPTTAFSLSLWVRFNDLSSIQGLWEATSNGPTYGNGGYVIWKSSANKIQFFIRQGSSWKVATSTTTVTVGDWFHVAGVWNGSSESKIYINGVSEGTSNPSSINYDSNTAINLGAYQSSGGSGKFSNAKLSNASIWNAALTSTQVTELYGSGAPTNLNNHSAYSNLVSWWQLGENSSFDGANWTVLDEKGTNNGTSANMGEDAIVNGVATSGNGISDSMGGADNIIGDAPYSTANAVSYGMGVDALSTDVPS